MNLFETAFAYVLRAFRPEELPPASSEHPADEPRGPLPEVPSGYADVPESPDSAPPIAVLMRPTPVETVVLDGGEDDEFADLLSGIGAVATPAAELSDLERKDREIAELQSNLEMLRPIGEELARVEQLRLAERATFETQLDELRGELEARNTAESSPPTAPQGPTPGLRDVSRLIEALDTTLSDARTGATPKRTPSEEALATAEGRLTRTREQLASARKRLAEQKQKTARRRAEGQELRQQVRALERERRSLIAERKLLHAPVRELVRRAKRRTKPLMRLVEVLGLEVD